MASVGYLLRHGQRVCTGTLVSSRHLLSASHCFRDEARTGIIDMDFVHRTPDGVTEVVPVAAFSRHPSSDIAVAVLGRDASASAFGLQFRKTPIDAEFIDEAVEVAGAGAGTPREQVVTFAVFFVSGFGEKTIQHRATREPLDGELRQGTCRGDSGGSVIYVNPSSANNAEIVAVVSRGADDCLGPDTVARVDVVASWLGEQLAIAPIIELGNCEAEESHCDADVHWRCRRGFWRREDCGRNDHICGFFGVLRGYGCLPYACGEIDATGHCDADTGDALWCQGGELRRWRCQVHELVCGEDDQSDGLRCVAVEPIEGAVDNHREPQTLGYESRVTPFVGDPEEDEARDQSRRAKARGGCAASRGRSTRPDMGFVLAALIGVFLIVRGRRR